MPQTPNLPAQPPTDEGADIAARLTRLEAGLDRLDGRLAAVLRLLDEQVALQRAGFLEDGHILRFRTVTGAQVALSLPDAVQDYIQRTILRSGTFYEDQMLRRLWSLGVVPAGSTIVDVGANIGNHSVFFGCVLGAGTLIAIEPQDHCAAVLETNLRLNGLGARAKVHRCLIGAAPGQGRMQAFQTRNLGGASFVRDDAGGVPMQSLDVLLDADNAENTLFSGNGLGLVKIDVEGMQMQVLAGAQRLLGRFRPPLWIEVRDADEARKEAAPFLSQWGYAAKPLGKNDFLFLADPS